MTISSDLSRELYTGDGNVSVYPYHFRIIEEEDLLVTVRDTDDVETTLELGDDYTVSGVGSYAGGNVTLTDGNLTDDYVLSIRRVRPLVQETDIRNQGDFYPEVHEDVFDHLVMIDQQQQNELDRSIKLAETSLLSFDATLPVGIEQGGVSLIINDTGDGFAVGPTAGEIASAQSHANTALSSATTAVSSAADAVAAADAAATTLAAASALVASINPPWRGASLCRGYFSYGIFTL